MLFSRAMVSACILWAILCLSPSASADAPQPDRILNAAEFVPTGLQGSLIEKDRPIAKLAVDSNKSVWLLGRTTLWRWHLPEASLQRVPLLKDAQDGARFRDMTSDGRHLFVAADHGLFQFNMNDARTFRYRHPLLATGGTLMLTGQSDQQWWLHQQGLMVIDRYGKKVTPLAKPFGVQAKDVLAGDPNHRQMWVGRGKKLVSVRIRANGDAEKRLVYKLKHPIDQIAVGKEEVFVSTKVGVHRFNHRGKLLQSVPVANGRQLQAMHITQATHSYLFSDGVLEVFDLATKKVKRYQLPVAKNVKQVALLGDVVGVLMDGKPRAFRLASAVK